MLVWYLSEFVTPDGIANGKLCLGKLPETALVEIALNKSPVKPVAVEVEEKTLNNRGEAADEVWVEVAIVDSLEDSVTLADRATEDSEVELSLSGDEEGAELEYPDSELAIEEAE